MCTWENIYVIIMRKNKSVNINDFNGAVGTEHSLKKTIMYDLLRWFAEVWLSVRWQVLVCRWEVGALIESFGVDFNFSEGIYFKNPLFIMNCSTVWHSFLQSINIDRLKGVQSDTSVIIVLSISQGAKTVRNRMKGTKDKKRKQTTQLKITPGHTQQFSFWQV